MKKPFKKKNLRKSSKQKGLDRKNLAKELYFRKLLQSYNRWLKTFSQYGDPCLLGSKLFTRSLPHD